MHHLLLASLVCALVLLKIDSSSCCYRNSRQLLTIPAEDEREARQSSLRGSPFAVRAAVSSPGGGTSSSPRFAILRSVDRNSSVHPFIDKKSTVAKKTLVHQQTPQKLGSSSRPRNAAVQLGGTDAASASLPDESNGAGSTAMEGVTYTPNSLEKEAFFPVEPQGGGGDDGVGSSSSSSEERPYCTNPVGLTLWHREEALGGPPDSPLDSPAPMVAGLCPPPAQVIRPMATRTSQWSWTVPGVP